MIYLEKGGNICGFGGSRFFYHKSDNAIGLTGSFLCIMQCLILIASIFPTERALKKNFTDEGIRR